MITAYGDNSRQSDAVLMLISGHNSNNVGKSVANVSQNMCPGSLSFASVAGNLNSLAREEKKLRNVCLKSVCVSPKGIHTQVFSA